MLIYIKIDSCFFNGGCRMEEKIYKVMKSAGSSNLVLGICVLVGGVAAGTLLIVNGARLLKNKAKIMF